MSLRTYIGSIVSQTTSDVKPSVTLTRSPTDTILTAATVTITATFNVSIIAFGGGIVFFKNSDIEGAVGNVSGSGSTFTQQITLPSNRQGTLEYVVTANSVSSTAGVLGPVDTTVLKVPFDTRGPDVELRRAIQARAITDTEQITAVWNQSVSNFVIGDISATWNDEDNLTGTLDNFAGSGSSYTFDINYPANGRGQVTITVAANAADGSNNRTGPAAARSIIIPYDLKADTPTDEPASLTLSKPVGTYRWDTYTVEMLWSKTVQNFTDSDIEVTGATKGTLTQDSTDNKLWRLPLTFTGSGTCTVKVPKESALAGTVLSPAEDTSVTFSYNVITTAFPTIAGVTELVNITEDIDDLDWLGSNAGGAFLGVSDMAVNGGRVYWNTQIQRKRLGADDEISQVDQSASTLNSVSTSGGSVTTHKIYPYITTSPRSPVIYNSELLYFVGSHYLYDGAVSAANKSLFENDIGWIIKPTSTNVSKVFLGFRSKTGRDERYDGIHGGTTSPMRIYDGGVLFYAGRSDLEYVDAEPPTQDTEADDIRAATEITDWQLLYFSDKLFSRIDILETNGKSGWAVLEELALITNSFIGFDKGVFTFKSRIPTKCLLSAAINASIQSLQYDTNNRDLPSAGIVAIDDELIVYTSNSSGRLGGLTRGAYGTSAVGHANNAEVFLVNHVLDASALNKPIQELASVTETGKLFNEIKLTYNDLDERQDLVIKSLDTASINENKRETLERHVPLSEHQTQWIKWIADQLLDYYGDIKYNISLELKPSPQLVIGDIVAIQEPVKTNLFKVGQVISISHVYADPPVTNIIVRSI